MAINDEDVIQQCRQLKEMFPFTQGAGQTKELDIQASELTLRVSYASPRFWYPFFWTFTYGILLFASILVGLQDGWQSGLGLGLVGLVPTSAVLAIVTWAFQKDHVYRDADGDRRLLTIRRGESATIHWQDVVIPWDELEACDLVTIRESWDEDAINGRYIVMRIADSPRLVVVCQFNELSSLRRNGLYRQIQTFCGKNTRSSETDVD